ncbi:hypothetical protein NFJ59_19970 [Citrobacter freundii]|nr:hypothetical protein [Citrobacter freundii]WFW12645.1 hypothetical protein NFJ59_19970 [Citrobacter freundii]
MTAGLLALPRIFANTLPDFGMETQNQCRLSVTVSLCGNNTVKLNAASRG